MSGVICLLLWNVHVTRQVIRDMSEVNRNIGQVLLTAGNIACDIRKKKKIDSWVTLVEFYLTFTFAYCDL